MLNNLEYSDKVKELAEIDSQLTALKTKKSELEAWFLTAGNEALKDSKNKSVCYKSDSGSSVTYTQAQKLTLEAPAVLKKLLGTAFLDFIEEKNEPTYKVKSAAVERMLIGLYTGDYTKILPSDVIAQLPCSSQQQAALAKKLKGANFETDVKNLMVIGEFSEEDASDYAYLYAEAVVYDTFRRLMEINGENDDPEEFIKGLAVAVSVDDTTKISIK
ncbi:MAG: hypothetical protein K2N36_07585 [Ruminiclostridium sp.]|nr:hypothetical protein [Ruminiclostridium sp.]